MLRGGVVRGAMQLRSSALPSLPLARRYRPSLPCFGDERRRSQEQRHPHSQAGETMRMATNKQHTDKLQALARGGGRLQAGALSNALEERARAGVRAEEKAYMEVLKRCKKERALQASQEVHAHLLSSYGGALSSGLVASLISVYGTCGRLDLARALFHQQQQQRGKEEGGTAMWNAMMQACTQCGRGKETLQLFQEMQAAGMPADAFTFSIVLKACGMRKDVEMGKRVHALLLHHNIQPDAILSSTLISMYGKCGELEEARAVFQGMKERDLSTWNTMIAVETQSGHGQEALELFLEMEQAGVAADGITFSTVLKACGMTGNMEVGKRVHAQLLRRGLLSIAEATSLIRMYSKGGQMEEARAVFQGMKERDVVTWTSMIVAETESGNEKAALQLFQQMQRAGVPADSFAFAAVLKACAMAEDLEMGKRVHGEMIRSGSLGISEANTLVSMYGKCGQMEEARAVFQSMKERDVVTWTSMIVQEAQSGHGKEALQLFQEMQRAGVAANAFTFAALLKACTTTADLKTGKQVHAELLRKGLLPNVVLSTALINMYGKCGELEQAHKVFRDMKEQDDTSWNAMIAMHGLHGQGKEALAALQEMQQQGVQPNAITFINVLNACSHAGLVEEGLACFAAMKERHGLQPTVEHYTCMVDLLGRAGRVEEAETLIHTMEVPPNAVTWMTLLGACRGAKDVERAERAAKQAIALNPMDAAPFVVLSNILAAAGRWEEVERVRKEMKERKVKKEPGRSWITVDGEVHSFVVKDRSHPRSAEIYRHLDQLNQEMKAAGYQPDLNWVLHDVADEQKEEELCHHSEKLAMAFGLLATPPGQPLQIMKNLRVCGDCHTATKFIAKVSQREILVRDANRFHRFSPDGRCSCGDYW
ncbi:Chlororespiratory reduction 2 [Balamuthia mandrillaris]